MKYLDFLIKYDKTVLEESRKLDDVNKKLRNDYLKLLGESCCEDGEKGCSESCNEGDEEPKQQFDEAEKKGGDDEDGAETPKKAKDGMLSQGEFYGDGEGDEGASKTEAPADETPDETDSGEVKGESTTDGLGEFFNLDPETERKIRDELANPGANPGAKMNEAEDTAAANATMDGSDLFNEGEGCEGCDEEGEGKKSEPPAATDDTTEPVTEKKDEDNLIKSMWNLNEEDEETSEQEPATLQESIDAVTQFVKASRKGKRKSKKS